jgi:hypothetical protein
MNSDRIELYERALALDPQNEPTMVGLSFALNNRVNARWSEDPAGDAARAERLADTALAFSRTMRWPTMQRPWFSSSNVNGKRQ